MYEFITNTQQGLFSGCTIERTCSYELFVSVGNPLEMTFLLGSEVSEEEEVGGLRSFRFVLVLGTLP